MADSLRQATQVMRIATKRRGLLDITSEIRGWVAQEGMTTAVLTVFCRHTSASLLIQENAAPEVRSDLEAFFEQLAPEDAKRYAHDDEGPDDMPAHLRTALTHVQLSIPVVEGRLALGTWQGIYLFEHRRRPHEREIVLHLIGA
jgi:secondary thiamine-phosphate synthase enzyme